MPISHVQLFSVPVTDQDRAIEFYRDALGFEVVSDTAMGPDRRWVLMALPGAQTSITLVTWFESMPAGSVRGIVLETSDLESTIGDLNAIGVTTSSIESAPWGDFTTFDDPDGNGFVLQTSAPSRV